MPMDPHERAALEGRVAQLEAKLDGLRRPHSAESAAEALGIQLEMGGRLRAVDNANNSDSRL